MAPRGEALAVGREPDARDPASVPLEGGVPALELSFPVEPLEAAEVLVADLARPMLLQQLQEAIHLVLLPRRLRQQHPHPVPPPSLQSLGLASRPRFLGRFCPRLDCVLLLFFRLARL